mgnify:CR=1 FL=1
MPRSICVATVRHRQRSARRSSGIRRKGPPGVGDGRLQSARPGGEVGWRTASIRWHRRLRNPNEHREGTTCGRKTTLSSGTGDGYRPHTGTGDAHLVVAERGQPQPMAPCQVRGTANERTPGGREQAPRPHVSLSLTRVLRSLSSDVCSAFSTASKSPSWRDFRPPASSGAGGKVV